MSRAAAALLLAAAIVGACGGGADRVTVAAGTTLVDSGFLDALVARFEAGHDVDVVVVGEATRHVLELGRRGAADVLITHAPDAEEAFLAEGLAAEVVPVLTSRFLLVGPADRAGVLAGLDPAAALGRVAEEQWTFVTRDDGSGTHERERRLWELAGIRPDGEPWYLATGQGMGLSLQVADQREGFTLAELGAFRAAAETLDLEVVETGGDPALLANPYRAIVVAGAPDGAGDFVTWLGSAETAAVVDALNEELFGEQVYVPAGR